MNKTFTTLQLFSLVDGRLSTNMDDVYDMLNHICDDDLRTHHLPIALKYVKSKAPHWYLEQKADLNAFKASFIHKNNSAPEFKDYIIYLKKEDKTINIPQLKDEFDISDFGEYMIDNSILLRK